ncbi:crustacean calcium-binding protein 23-like [Macrobrachium rosenbergii]|uniref:crustacean calcium-binding protein 23-like n=1 Tax=Macrobrachium rosenbergii TaxID=79674 RepID=UPI0034D76394
MTREDAMKEACAHEAEHAHDPLEKLRCLVLSRGYDSILQFGKMFRRLDEDKSLTLSKEEFMDVLQQFGLDMSSEEFAEIYAAFDEDGTGSINYSEFLDKLRPEMNDARKEVVEEAFAKLDESGDGVVTLDDIRDRYDASHHPKVLSEESTEEEVLLKFLGRFEGGVSEDGKVTKEEFLDYYSGISKSIDDDEYFITVIKNSWKL